MISVTRKKMELLVRARFQSKTRIGSSSFQAEFQQCSTKSEPEVKKLK